MWMCCCRKLLLDAGTGKLKTLPFALTLLLFRGYMRDIGLCFF